MVVKRTDYVQSNFSYRALAGTRRIITCILLSGIAERAYTLYIFVCVCVFLCVCVFVCVFVCVCVCVFVCVPRKHRKINRRKTMY